MQRCLAGLAHHRPGSSRASMSGPGELRPPPDAEGRIARASPARPLASGAGNLAQCPSLEDSQRLS